MSEPCVLELRTVWKSYGRNPVLKGVSFSLSATAPTALLGPTGSGKSTILRILAGLETPDSGQVLMDGHLVSDAGRILIPPHGRGVSMVFQDLALWPNLTSLDNVALGLSGTCRSRREARSRAQEALHLCRIEGLANRRPGTLSGGEQQRVALARALATRPRLLVLDEPFSGLDFVTKAQLLSEITTISSRRGTTVLVVTHDLLEALSLTENAIVLENGSVAASGPIRDLAKSSEMLGFKLFRDRVAVV